MFGLEKLGVMPRTVLGVLALETLISAGKFLHHKDARSFFGLNLLKSNDDIQIVLQSDSIVDILASEPYHVSSVIPGGHSPSAGGLPNQSLDDLIANNPNGRFLKAREWVNRFDAAGARQLLLKLSEFEKRTAVIIPVKHGDGEDAGVRPIKIRGLLIAMGLGYTDFSIKMLNGVCEGWARIGKETKEGDCLEVNSLLLDRSRRLGFSLLQRVPVDELKPQDENSWDRLFPFAWDIDKWRASSDRSIGRPSHHSAKSVDYGIILRHTNREGGAERVEFICAGFSEFGTFMAGRYLANHWNDLRKDAMAKDRKGRGHGDFLAIIAGESFVAVGWKLAYFISAVGMAEFADTPSSPLSNSKWARRSRGASPEMHELQPRVLLSYAHLDKEFANHLVGRLQSDGVRVWWDQESLFFGENYVEEIELAIGGHDIVAIVLSKNSLRSKWVLKELELARLADHGPTIIPILIGGLSPNEVPVPIKDLHWVECKKTTMENQAYDHLLRSIQRRNRSARSA